MARIVKWNAQKLVARVPKVMAAYGEVIGPELEKQLATVQFDWPNPTLRFTSLFMGGSPQRNRSGALSPPTTKAGARNTRQFKRDAQSGSPSRGVIISEGPRDAVDTGVLLRSQTPARVVVNNGIASLSIRWNAPYSGVVLRGGNYGSYVNVNGKVVNVGYKPGRDWITPALVAQPFAPFFKQRWRALGAGS